MRVTSTTNKRYLLEKFISMTYFYFNQVMLLVVDVTLMLHLNKLSFLRNMVSSVICQNLTLGTLYHVQISCYVPVHCIHTLALCVSLMKRNIYRLFHINKAIFRFGKNHAPQLQIQLVFTPLVTHRNLLLLARIQDKIEWWFFELNFHYLMISSSSFKHF